MSALRAYNQLKMTQGSTSPPVNARGLTKTQAYDERRRRDAALSCKKSMSNEEWVDLKDAPQIGGLFRIPDYKPRSGSSTPEDPGGPIEEYSPWSNTPEPPIATEINHPDRVYSWETEKSTSTATTQRSHGSIRSLGHKMGEKLHGMEKEKLKLWMEQKRGWYRECPRLVPEGSDALTRTQRISQRFMNLEVEREGYYKPGEEDDDEKDRGGRRKERKGKTKRSKSAG